MIKSAVLLVVLPFVLLAVGGRTARRRSSPSLCVLMIPLLPFAFIGAVRSGHRPADAPGANHPIPNPQSLR